jgi:hypothetical protein
MKISAPQPLPLGMITLANFINENRKPRIVEISKGAKPFKALVDEDYVNKPLQTEFVPFDCRRPLIILDFNPISGHWIEELIPTA